MKKLLLLTITTGITFGAFAQRSAIKEMPVKISNSDFDFSHVSSLGRTTAVGDTFVLVHVGTPADTPALYNVVNDSGFVAGTDGYGDQGFAERYDFNGADSSVKVIGVISLFGGNILATSTKTITFKVWSQGAKTVVTGRPNLYNSGFPNTVLTSQSAAITSLGIGISVGDTASDTTKLRYFTTPTAYLGQSFFIGYQMTYSWAALAGDTLGLYSNKDGERAQALLTFSGPDSIINNVNATMYDDNTWHDDATDNFQVFYNLRIFPVVKIGVALGVNGITRNDFTFFGNYPNPATNNTNIRFSLAKSTDVTIRVMDINGRVINTITNNNLSVGEHIVSVETSNMPAGEYVYSISTKEGNGIASTMTVIK